MKHDRARLDEVRWPDDVTWGANSKAAMGVQTQVLFP